MPVLVVFIVEAEMIAEETIDEHDAATMRLHNDGAPIVVEAEAEEIAVTARTAALRLLQQQGKYSQAEHDGVSAGRGMTKKRRQRPFSAKASAAAAVQGRDHRMRFAPRGKLTSEDERADLAAAALRAAREEKLELVLGLSLIHI